MPVCVCVFVQESSRQPESEYVQLISLHVSQEPIGIGL